MHHPPRRPAARRLPTAAAPYRLAVSAGFRNGGLYRQPLPRHIVIHRIKGAAGMGYVWRRLHDGAAHDPVECARQAEIELPRQALVFSPLFQARLKAGTASISLDQKTNRMQMRFGRAPAGELMGATLGAALEAMRSNRNGSAAGPAG